MVGYAYVFIFFQKENIFTVPNLLGVIRIGLTPYVGYLVLKGEFHWACYVFAFAGFTDLVRWCKRQQLNRAHQLDVA